MDTAYDRVPYPTATYTQTHVRRLAAIARLFGVNAPDIRACRVLEIGCGEGANLVGMAVDLPESQFVGIDLSQTAIARATELAKHAGVENVTFRQSMWPNLGRPANAITSSRTECFRGCPVKFRTRCSSSVSASCADRHRLYQLQHISRLACTGNDR